MEAFIRNFFPVVEGSSGYVQRCQDARTVASLIEAAMALSTQIQLVSCIEDPTHPGMNLAQAMGPFYAEALREILLAIKASAQMIGTDIARLELENTLGGTHGG